jgi:hypothetical protein
VEVELPFRQIITVGFPSQRDCGRLASMVCQLSRIGVPATRLEELTTNPWKAPEYRVRTFAADQSIFLRRRGHQGQANTCQMNSQLHEFGGGKPCSGRLHQWKSEHPSEIDGRVAGNGESHFDLNTVGTLQVSQEKSATIVSRNGRESSQQVTRYKGAVTSYLDHCSSRISLRPSDCGKSSRPPYGGLSHAHSGTRRLESLRLALNAPNAAVS